MKVAVLLLLVGQMMKKVEKYKQILSAVLDAEEIFVRNRFCFLEYNPPYEVLNGRNEIIVELEIETINNLVKHL